MLRLKPNYDDVYAGEISMNAQPGRVGKLPGAVMPQLRYAAARVDAYKMYIKRATHM
jgi:hypothetical protein